MSLVNDMLKALEQRDGLNATADGRTDYFQELEACGESQFKRGKTVWLLLGLVLTTVTSATVMRVIGASDSQPQLATTAAVDTATDVGKIAATKAARSPISPEKPATYQAQPDFNLLPEVDATDVDNGAAQRIAQLIQQAELALVDNRLTEPVDDNAYSRYQSILLLDPSHATALAGIRTIVERYVAFSQQTAARGESTKAKRYWRKAQIVAKQYPPIRHWLAAQVAPTSASASVAQVAAEESVETEAQVAAQPPGETNDTQLQVQPSNRFKDKKLARQAKTLISEQRWREAEQLLIDGLVENQDFTQSRQVLFDLYLQQQKPEAAEALLDRWPDLSVDRQALLQARVQVQQQNWHGAAALLEQQLATVEANEEYLALLAAVYHQIGRYREAAEQYEQLLAIDKSNSAYWLGLAVSYDALTDRNQALRAFRFARLYGGLDDNTFTYVEQRIEALTVASSAG